MTRQEFARKRNWNLARLIGFSLNCGVTTEEEVQTYLEIQELLDELKDNYDANSVALGIDLKPYTCYHCRKRSNKQHIYGNYNYCLKHYKEELASNSTPGTSGERFNIVYQEW